MLRGRGQSRPRHATRTPGDLYDFPATDDDDAAPASGLRRASSRTMKTRTIQSQSSPGCSTPARCLASAKPTSATAGHVTSETSSANRMSTRASSRRALALPLPLPLPLPLLSPAVMTASTSDNKTPCKRAAVKASTPTRLPVHNDNDCSTDEDEALQPMKKIPASTKRKLHLETTTIATPSNCLARSSGVNACINTDPDKYDRHDYRDDDDDSDSEALLPTLKKQKVTPPNSGRITKRPTLFDDTTTTANTVNHSTSGSSTKVKFGQKVLSKAKTVILNRLSGTTPPRKLIGLDDQFHVLYDLVSRTIRYGEGNSVVCIGARGTGKSMTLKMVLDKIRSEHEESDDKLFIEVFLSGLLHTDDRYALRSIARALKTEQSQDQNRPTRMSFSESLQHVLDTLRSGNAKSMPVIIVIDEFDIFASHSTRQHLLYNLFDAAQSGHSPVLIVGLSHRFDVLEGLEKRVKSRFSQRQVYFYPPQTPNQFIDIFKNHLLLDVEADGLMYDEAIDRNEMIAYVQRYNHSVQSLLKDAMFKEVCKDECQFGLDMRRLRNILFVCVSCLKPEQPLLDEVTFTRIVLEQNVDTSRSLIASLSALETCVLLSIRTLLLANHEIVNFEMVYDEYQSYLQASDIRSGSSSASKVSRSASVVSVELCSGVGVRDLKYPRSTVMKAFERLIVIGFLKPCSDRGGGGDSGVFYGHGLKQYRMVKAMFSEDDAGTWIRANPDLPTFIEKWAKST
ncbi:hypothetical protein SeMB42_g07246 [Synchytrium endobioticum]|uniref:Uncharacterized protein n=1 Tax=Synchytrium endobioticum TaxID=286115 RepID=A0A507D3S7_9FUNG|nr:hypothetical protein SeMB42_g07246 [Synchytrium endobioticum]TPX46159.1 hypothetical protein SeLEV6574_g03380 [Synchytrium endobioticum]